MISSIATMWCFFFFLAGLTKILMSNKLITILMSLELIMLSIFFFLNFSHSSWFSSGNSVIFLSFMVCESVMGLGLYIQTIRLVGSDKFKSMNM
nr:NADH dehydrogenase subunit 4L [Colpocephalum spinicollis]